MKRGFLLALLSLLAACDRNLYVGRDEPPLPADTTEEASAGAPATPPAPSDAGASVPPVVEPAPPSMPSVSTAAPCDAQHADCDGDPDNGCETNVMQDRNHCGACGARCETADCSCESGKLTLHCDSTHGDCDGMVSNGCETELTTSMQHCGACQRTCHANGHDATSASCVAGRCEVTCAPRLSQEADCDGDPDNGCETYLLFDAQHCGQCGNACATSACEAGVCML